jgi:hypothetical protein
MKVLKSRCMGIDLTGRIRARRGFLGRMVLQVEEKRLMGTSPTDVSRSLHWRDARVNDLDLQLENY